MTCDGDQITVRRRRGSRSTAIQLPSNNTSYADRGLHRSPQRTAALKSNDDEKTVKGVLSSLGARPGRARPGPARPGPACFSANDKIRACSESPGIPLRAAFLPPLCMPRTADKHGQ